MSWFFHYIIVPSVFPIATSRHIIGFCCRSQICARQLNRCNILVSFVFYFVIEATCLVLAFFLVWKYGFLFLSFILYWGMVDLQCFFSFRFKAVILFHIYPFFFSLEICYKLFPQTLCEVVSCCVFLLRDLGK